MTGSRHLWYQPMVVMAFHALRPLRHFQGPVTLCPPLSIHLRSARPSPSADQLCFVDFVLFDRLTVWPLISFFTWDKNWEVSWKVIAFYTAGTNFCWRNSKSKGIQSVAHHYLSLDCWILWIHGIHGFTRSSAASALPVLSRPAIQA